MSSPPQPQEDDGELQTLGPLGAITAEDLSAAHERAVAFLRAYTNTVQPAAGWWSGLQPLLSPAAAEDYSYVDPSEVPAFEVEAEPLRDLPGGSSAFLQVQVPTSLGDYVVTLTRTGVNDPWLVERADPPAPAS